MSKNKPKHVPCQGPLKFLVFRKGAFRRFDICSVKKLFPWDKLRNFTPQNYLEYIYLERPTAEFEASAGLKP